MTSDFPAVSVCTNHPDVGEGLARCTRCQRNFCGDCLVILGGQPYCATCKDERVLDLRSGVASAVSIASRRRRFGGIFIDGLIFYPLNLAISFGSRFVLPAEWIVGNFFLVMLFTNGIFFVYDALMMARDGRTLGKMAVKTRVVRIDGSPITTKQAWGRAALRLVLQFTFIFDWLPIFFTTDKICLHDMLAGTRVVRTD